MRSLRSRGSSSERWLGVEEGERPRDDPRAALIPWPRFEGRSTAGTSGSSPCSSSVKRVAIYPSRERVCHSGYSWLLVV
jgi:hypothetical protein